MIVENHQCLDIAEQPAIPHNLALTGQTSDVIASAHAEFGIMQRRDHTSRFPWYDAIWLDRYLKAREFIAQHHPSQLDEFVIAFKPLRTRPDFEVRHLRDAITPEAMLRIRTAIKALKPEKLELHEIRNFGRWVVQDDPVITELQATLIDMVSEAAGESVEPCYNFLSIYTRLGRCGVHMDAPEAKWTLDVCIDHSESWPIHIGRVLDWPESYEGEADWEAHVRNDPGNGFVPYTMQPGEALLFSGSSQWHYRDPLPAQGNGYCHLVFFHFIPAGMADIVRFASWESTFGIPGLSDAIGLNHE